MGLHSTEELPYNKESNNQDELQKMAENISKLYTSDQGLIFRIHKKL
jgi:uncharacterized FlaG/YvyC family protein